VSFIDVVVLILFVLFMFFVFGGYHHDKYQQRSGEGKYKDQKSKNSEEDEETIK